MDIFHAVLAELADQIERISPGPQRLYLAGPFYHKNLWDKPGQQRCCLWLTDRAWTSVSQRVLWQMNYALEITADSDGLSVRTLKDRYNDPGSGVAWPWEHPNQLDGVFQAVVQAIGRIDSRLGRGKVPGIIRA